MVQAMKHTCRCSTISTTVEELLRCEAHLKGHTIIACQVCGSAVCKLFFGSRITVEETKLL